MKHAMRSQKLCFSQKNVQSQLSEITFFCLETKLTTKKKKNLNTANHNIAYNLKYMHALC